MNRAQRRAFEKALWVCHKVIEEAHDSQGQLGLDSATLDAASDALRLAGVFQDKAVRAEIKRIAENRKGPV